MSKNLNDLALQPNNDNHNEKLMMMGNLQQQQRFFLCEETWEWDYETGHADDHDSSPDSGYESPQIFSVYGSVHPPLLEQDLHWDPDELSSLLSKQDLYNHFYRRGVDGIPTWLLEARDDAVDWIMKVHTFYSFSAPTAVLAVDYLDRFLLSCFGTLGNEKPWMTQLSAVTCLSLAAKVEETRVPLLLDFQVEESCYMFKAKDIQRMEVVVLSSLKWRMNPVTPLSFLDFAIRRLGFKDVGLCWAFRRAFEKLLLSVLLECRFVGYLPSVLASAIMLHVAATLKLDMDVPDILGADKEVVGECYKLVSEFASRRRSNKRKLGSSPVSPRGVMDIWCNSDNSSNEWWAASRSTSASSSPERTSKQRMGERGGE